MDSGEAAANLDGQATAFKQEMQKILGGSKMACNLVRMAVIIAVLYILVMTYMEPFMYMKGQNPTTEVHEKTSHELNSLALLPALLAMALIIMQVWSYKYAAVFVSAVVIMFCVFYFCDAGKVIKMSSSIYDGEKIVAGFMTVLAVFVLYVSKAPSSKGIAHGILALAIAVLAVRSSIIHGSEEWQKEEMALKVASVIKTVLLFSIFFYFLMFHVFRKKMQGLSFGPEMSSI